MAYQALYRKLRPSTFSAVFGQDEVVKTLKNQVKFQQVAHAYLFCGTRGTGKTSLAKIMANAINCQNPKDYEPCGECSVCLSLKSDSNVDVVELDAASRNGVDDMRELLERVAYPPQMGKYKVYIIDEVHMLSISAFNALLKTLEEPPEHVIFILATTESQKIPATILSRCQRFDLNRISATLIFEKMKEELQKQNIAYEDSALMELAIAADGSVRDGWSILDICISGMPEGSILDEARVQNMLGTSSRAFVLKIAQAIAEHNLPALLAHSEQLMQEGKEPLVSLKQLAQVFRNLLVVKVCKENVDERISAEEYQALKELAKQMEYKRMLAIVDLFMEQEQKLKWASNPRIGFESALLQAASPAESYFDNEDAIQQLSAQIDALAQREPRIVQVESAAVSPSPTSPAAPTPPPQENPKPLFRPDENCKRIWKELKKRIHGMLCSYVQAGELIREDGKYFLVFEESNKFSYNFILSKPEHQEMLSNLLRSLIGEDCTIGLRLVKKDNSYSDKIIENNIKSLEETLPSGILQVVD